MKANVSKIEMDSLIKNAHVNILLSFQSAGMKLKLLNALFKGRFCVVNDFMVENSAMKELCLVGNKPEELIKILKDILTKEFSKKRNSDSKRKIGRKIFE